MSVFRLALAQLNLTVGDLEGNTRRICEAIDAARDRRADLVIFPELAITGYPPEDLLLKPDFVRDNLACLEEIAARTHGIAAAVGFVDAADHLYNAAALLSDGRRASVYRKHRLPNYGVFDEKRYFHPGQECPVFVLRGVPVGITVCEDIWYPGGPCMAQAEAGALVLVNLNGSPYHAGKWRLRAEMIQTRARDYAAVVAYVNLVGGQDELLFDGMSFVVGHDGELLARARQFEEDLLLCDIDPEEVRRARRYNPVRGTESTGTDGLTPTLTVVSPARAQDGRAPLPPRVEEPLDATDEVYRALVLGLRDYVRKNGFRDVVVGLSGGVDSSLVAAIATDALGRERVHGVFMPSPFTSEDSERYVRALVGNLGIDLTVVPIEGPFDAFRRALRDAFGDRPPDVTEENVQARVRGTLLMALSNKFGWLVLATGNKSELSCGYATLYGDLAGGFAVIKDVPKTLVYRLARHRNAAREVIPRGVLERAPTAELRPGQVDQETLPPYDVLDAILRLYVEEDAPPAAVVAAGFDPATVAKVAAMVDRSEYKRRQAPPGIKITPKAFGRDRRLPITNWYRGTVGTAESASAVNRNTS
ncbi:MAG: NAD+ synthase [Armatimonadetes bacterium]|nr:NAD+ synthase [Armatimonadota bacterium]